MRRLITSLAADVRLNAASEFLSTRAGREVLLIAASRAAADELVRRQRTSFGVHRFTLPSFAFSIASERMAEAGRSVLAGVAIEALAARTVHECHAARELDWFEPVWNTPGFVRAAAHTIGELRMNRVDAGSLLAAGPPGKDLAALLKRFEENLSESLLEDPAGVYRIAAEAARGEGFSFANKPQLLVDVEPGSRLETEFIAALSEVSSELLATAHRRNTISLVRLRDALSTPPEALPEPGAASTLGRLREHVFERTANAAEIDASFRFVSASDESGECVEMARGILALAEAGTPFDRIAVVLRNPDRYQPLVEDALQRAGIPAFYTLGSRRPNPAGRAMLALLACASEGLSASRFSEYLSLGQVPTPGEAGAEDSRWVPPAGDMFPPLDAEQAEDESEIPEERPDDGSPVISGSLQTPRHWEKLLVDAAVIGGRDRWLRRLDGLDRELRRRASQAQIEDDPARSYLDRQIGRLGNLRAFALPIVDLLDRFPREGVWKEWLDRLVELARMALRRPESVLAALAELQPMSAVGPLALDEVRAVLSHRLAFLRSEPPGRRYGKVFVTSASEVGGHTFDAVFLPGLAEDVFPRGAFEDPLLLDEQRTHLSPWLTTQEARFAGERLLFNASIAAAGRTLWISYPRMHLGHSRPRNPSFYALDVLRAATGRIPSLQDMQTRGLTESQSQIGWPAPRDPALAIDDAEYDLAVIARALRTPEAARGRGRYLVTASRSLARSLRARAGRWRRPWCESDGIVARADGTDAEVVQALAGHRLAARAYSATALQQFAACPYRFALQAIHRLQTRTVTEAIERMDPLTRGSLIHGVQFRILSELRSLGLLPVTAENLGAVQSAADRVLEDARELYREELVPAIPRIWDIEMETIRWDVRGWLQELARPSNMSWTPRWFELAFGLPLHASSTPRDPASRSDSVQLACGVSLRGAIDLVEESPAAIRITDHKTGKAPARPPGATGHGEVLQPILYAEAAEAMLAKPVASARLLYCTERGGYRAFETPIDEEAHRSLAAVTRTIDRSLAEGFLPAAPRSGACTYCDYRPVCGPYEETRVRLKNSERIAPIEELRDLP